MLIVSFYFKTIISIKYSVHPLTFGISGAVRGNHTAVSGFRMRIPVSKGSISNNNNKVRKR